MVTVYSTNELLRDQVRAVAKFATEEGIKPIVWVPEVREEITGAVAVFTDHAIRPTHAVNPLDVQGEIISYEPLPIPPHVIFRVAEIQKDWFVFAGEHRVHVPRRFTDTAQLPD